MLFSISGFTDKLIALADERRDLLLFGETGELVRPTPSSGQHFRL